MGTVCVVSAVDPAFHALTLRIVRKSPGFRARFRTVLCDRALLPESSDGKIKEQHRHLHNLPDSEVRTVSSAFECRNVECLRFLVELFSAGSVTSFTLRPWSPSTTVYDESSCASAWSVKEHNISKDGWPWAQSAFCDRPEAKTITRVTNKEETTTIFRYLAFIDIHAFQALQTGPNPIAC